MTVGVELYGGRLLKLQATYSRKFHFGAAAGEGAEPIADDVFLFVGQIALDKTF